MIVRVLLIFKFVIFILIDFGNLFGVVVIKIVYKFWVKVFLVFIFVDLLINWIFVLIFVVFFIFIDKNLIWSIWLVKVFNCVFDINVLMFLLLIVILIMVLVLCLCKIFDKFFFLK